MTTPQNKPTVPAAPQPGSVRTSADDIRRQLGWGLLKPAQRGPAS